MIMSIIELLDKYKEKQTEKEIISFQIEKTDKDKLQDIAKKNSNKENKISVSELIRVAVKDLLSKENNKKKDK